MPRSQQRKKTCWTRNKQEPLRSSLGWREHPNWSERKCLSPEMQQKLDTRWTWTAPEQRRHEERVTSAILEKMGRGNEMGAVMQAMARSRQNVGGHHFSSTSKSKRKSRARKRSKSRKSRRRSARKSRARKRSKSRARKRSKSRKSRARKRSKSRGRKRSKSRARKRSKSRKSRVKKLPKKIAKTAH